MIEELSVGQNIEPAFKAELKADSFELGRSTNDSNEKACTAH